MGQLVQKIHVHGQIPGRPTPPSSAEKLFLPSPQHPPPDTVPLSAPSAPAPGTTTISFQSRRRMQEEASLELSWGGKTGPGCHLPPALPPAFHPPPRAGPGAGTGNAPAGQPASGCGARGAAAPFPSLPRLASPPRSLRAPARTPTSGRVTVSAAPAGPPRPGSRGGGSRRPRWGRGLPWRGAAAPYYCLPGIPRLLTSGAAPSPPPPARSPARVPPPPRGGRGRRRSRRRRAGPRRGRVYKLTPGTRAEPHIKGRVPHRLPSLLAIAQLTSPRAAGRRGSRGGEGRGGGQRAPPIGRRRRGGRGRCGRKRQMPGRGRAGQRQGRS